MSGGVSGGIPAWAVPGARVVCVDSGNPEAHVLAAVIGLAMPRKGDVYTVTRAFWSIEGGPAILVDECPVATELCGDIGFPITHFRPLTDRPNDAERFTARLFEGFDGVGADDPSPRVMPREPEEVPFG